MDEELDDGEAFNILRMYGLNTINVDHNHNYVHAYGNNKYNVGAESIYTMEFFMTKYMLSSLIDDIKKSRKYDHEEQLRKKYPSLQEAYEQYQMMVKLYGG